MKKKIILLFIMCFMFLPLNIFAEGSYVTITELKINNITPESGPSTEGDDVFYGFSRWNEKDNYDDCNKTNNLYSFVITGYGLEPASNYSYIIKSEIKNSSVTVTGEQLLDGVTITGNDGDRIFSIGVKDSNDSYIPNKVSIGTVEHSKDLVYIKFNDHNLEDYYNEIAPDGIIKLDSIDPRGDEYFSDAAHSSALHKYNNDRFWVFGGDGYLQITDYGDFYSWNEYPVKYEYMDANPTIKSVIDSYAKKFKVEEGQFDGSDSVCLSDRLFVMEDLELINYYYYEGSSNQNIDDLLRNVLDYSSGFREAIGNDNIGGIVDIRALMSEQFLSCWFGESVLTYDDVIYAYADVNGVKFKNIIYIPNETNNNRNAYIDAALNRIKSYLPEANIDISYGGDLNSINFDDNLFKLNDIVDVSKTIGEYYKININGKSYDFLIVKDSSKMNTPYMYSKDILTDISISSNSSEVPLDAEIKVKVIDNNKDYLKIIQIAKGKSFDLKLHSDVLDDYISKINDVFIVKIPVDKEYNGQTLKVHFIDTNNKDEVHYAKVTDGYAQFETNHFSVYTVEFPENVPQTSDNILISFCELFISLLVSIFVIVKLKENYN